ncbi:MAG TPA: DUF1631 family protein [Burkholderiaceae bacterium]
MDGENLLSDWFDSCRTELQAAAAKWYEAASSALDAAHGAADSMRCASRLYHAKRALDRMQPFLPKRFVELLESSMSERFSGVSAPFRGMALSDDIGLVDDDVVNESIEVSRIAARVLVEAEWEIREAEQGLSQQLGRKVAGERISPFHPETFARVVLRLTEEMSLNAEERADCLRVAPDAIVEFARTTCASAIAWFGRADATASFVLKRSGHHRPIAIPVDVGFGAPDIDLETIESAIGEGMPLPMDPSQDLRPLDARDHVFRGVISGIDAVLSDFRLTSELKRVLSGLQMAVMRFAFGSPETLYSPEHRLWSVSRKLADYALANCLRDRVAHDDFILFADHTIQALLPLDTRSLRGVAPHLDAIDTFVRTRPQHLMANEENAMQNLARLEDGRRKVLGAAINRHRKQIDAVMGQTEMPFRLRQFMLVDWAEVLARTELSEGAESGAYAEYWDAAQRVVARIQAGSAAENSAEDIGPLLEVLERGMATVSVPSVEKHELAAAFVRPDALARHEWLETDTQPASLARVGGAEDYHRKPFWGAREFEREPAMVVSTMAQVSGMPASDAEQWVNGLRLGSLIELFLLGTWLEVRVMSISGAGNLFMFKDELGGNSHPLTRRALLRLVREGLAGPL